MNLEESLEYDVIEIIKETEKAWEIKISPGVYWFPKSQCRLVNNKKIYMPEWLAKKKEIV